jgi:hypothetical protein
MILKLRKIEIDYNKGGESQNLNIFPPYKPTKKWKVQNDTKKYTNTEPIYNKTKQSTERELTSDSSGILEGALARVDTLMMMMMMMFS